MAGTDPADTHGHDLDDAEAQEPTLDIEADPASETQPTGGPNELVLAQSTAEVQAQIDNVPG
jgi:hypothetical protein